MMFRNKKIQVSIVLCISLLFSSCLEDQGNYDYIDINEVTIAGIEDSYVINRLDNFDIKPELIFTQDNATEGRYTYKWQAFKVSGAPIDPDKLKDLSTEKNLTLVASLAPGDHIIYYTVSDTITGVSWQHNFNVKIINSLFEGWLVLNDVNGEARLDMISLFDQEYRPIHDVLEIYNSELVLEGTPGFVAAMYLETAYQSIYVSTSGNGTTRIDDNTFGWTEAFRLSAEFGSPQPNILEAQNIINKGGNRAFCVFDGNIYYFYRPLGTIYSTPRNLVGGVKFEASTMIGKGSSLGNSIFYDNTNLRFVYYNGGTECFPMPEANNVLFNYTTAKQLVHLVSNNYGGLNGRETFAVLKDPNNKKHYMARFNSVNFVQSYYDEIIATDFDQATNIAISPEFGYVFYSVGGKLYEYDLFTKQTIQMLDKGSEEITFLKFHDFAGGVKLKTLGNDLIVGSVDPSKPAGSNGTMELYDILPVNGQIQLTNKFDGFGKIVSVSYKE